ncbi:HAD family hydrolase [Acinetobacter tianfuensis]|uniref:Haloacid dehalogenase-like hydrolase n=1 Tax=Acinetobacter tianfuensis TaxID=2419603 RepID=A0A3A8EA75_9GAMM|nr:HAD family hydrolase [Acinetobacter tianfuensis]RKG31099.1 haloacid dehalogenase-like hydrolase [Acinetobacter tianfuensis]
MHDPNQAFKNLALFDFDGTLCSKDSFTGFIFYSLSKRHIVRQGLKILPWIQGYYLNVYPAHAMRPKLYSAMFKNTDAADIHELANAYAQELMQYLNPDLLQQMQQHQQLGHQVALVSASVDLYLKPVCSLLGIDLICSEVEIKNSKMTGSYITADCSGEQKRSRILEKYNLHDFDSVYAYGNSHEDLAMLDLADHRYMVGEDKNLPALAQSLSA